MSSTKRLISNSTIVFSGMMIANIFSYLFNMMMGRLLGPIDYGELTLLLSFFMVASVAAGAISTLAMRYSGELYFAKAYATLRKFFKFLVKNVLILSLVLVFGILVFIKPISVFFSISNWVTVLPVLVTIVFFLVLTTNKGFLQGVQRFVSVSYLGAVEMVLRFGLGLAFVIAGFRIYGALGGILLATAITYILSIYSIKKVNLDRLADGSSDGQKLDRKEMISYGAPALLSSTMLILSLNMDIFLVKHYFPADQAGLYAAISVIAKIILYVSAPVIQVMFPMISEHRAKGEKHYKIFLYSLVLTLLASLLVLGVYTIAPGTVIKILYGTKYTAFYALLPTVGLAFLFYSLVNLMSNYFMAIKNFTFAWFYLVAIIFQIIAVTIWHGELFVVARIFVFSFAILFALMLGYYTFLKRQQIAAFMSGDYEQ